MGRKKKVVEEPKVEKLPQGKVFEYGDLAVVCKCGRTQIIHKGIQGGFNIVMTTNESSYVQLKCDSCDADMKLCFLEGEKPEETIKPTDESIQEENKQEESL